MEKDYAAFIKRCLDNTVPLVPEPTGVRASLKRFCGIRAVLFDIYGTLLVSASGDIGGKRFTEAGLIRCLEETGIGLERPGHHEEDARKILSGFREAIRRDHEEKNKQGIPFPEVDIIGIWGEVLGDAEKEHILRLPEGFKTGIFAFLFELATNRVSPMPGMTELIRECTAAGIVSGIISNAQFYTPVILNYFINGRICDCETVEPFRPDLTFFSYRFSRSKPDGFLFERAKEKLFSYDIPVCRTIYVGNDMKKDIVPAMNAGFKAVLFAGDKRSLGLLPSGKPDSGRVPDAVITDLLQLREVIGIEAAAQ
ncbi:MAG: HAD family hydrolase [Spirochaetales bacterium]|nr:HAD family hydrolase [Spirochaetales bacterium]